MKVGKIRRILDHKFFKAKYPITPQYDQVDCGPAALLSILKYYGGDASLVYLRELCQVDVEGTTMLELVNAAKSLGFDANGATGEYEDLMKEDMPCIAHVILETGLNHFIVIWEIDSKGVLVGDPGRGKYKLSKEEFIDIWKQKAVILLKPKDNLYTSTSSSWFSWIIAYVKKELSQSCIIPDSEKPL